MALFGFGKKKTETVTNAVPVRPEKYPPMGEPGYWEKESYMMALLCHPNLDILGKAQERLEGIQDVEVINFAPPADDSPMMFTISYRDEVYEFSMVVAHFELSQQLALQRNRFTEEEWEGLLTADASLIISMKFNKNAKKSFHLQLKIIAALAPDLLGVYDESSEKLICPRWIRMAAESDVPPSPEDMYLVQAVSGSDGKIWLHTHGLNRCGLTELEILESDQEHVNDHFHIINTMAKMLLDKKENYKQWTTCLYLGILSNQMQILGTFVHWNEAIFQYPNLKLGGLEDRQDGHNSLTSVIFLYASEADHTNRKLTYINDFNSLWSDNPLFMISTEETDRMERMARTRFDYVLNAHKKGMGVLIKIGLPVDDGEPDEHEHIWFELKEFDKVGVSFLAELTQEPYNVSGIHTGDTRWFTISDVTDWLIFTGERTVTPDQAYLL